MKESRPKKSRTPFKVQLKEKKKKKERNEHILESMVSLDTHIGWLKRSWICMSLLQREVTTEKERQFKKKKKTPLQKQV